MTFRITSALLLGLLAPAGLIVLSGPFSVATAQESAVNITGVVRIVEGPSLLDSFRRPRSLFLNPARDLIFVADSANHRVVIFDGDWRSRGTISYSFSVDRPQPGEPWAVAQDERGRLFVVDGLSTEIEVLSPRGTHITRIQPQLEVSGLEAKRPQDIAIGPSGRIYILYGGADGGGIVVLDAKGAMLGTLGLDGKGENALIGPMALAIGPDEAWVAVADPMGERQVHLLSLETDEARSFGKGGRQNGMLSIAIDVAWGPGNTLWVTDTSRNTIEVFDESGAYRGRIGGFGYGPGQFRYPAGCAFLAPDRLVVLERAGARIQVLEIDVAFPGEGKRASSDDPAPTESAS